MAAAKPDTPLRQMLFFMEIVRDMEELCPAAWLIMASNPVFEGCTLINRQSTIKVVGLCHGFREGVRNIAEVLGFDPAEVHAQTAGLNHNVWLTHLFHNGEDIYPLIEEWIKTKSTAYWNSPAFNGGKLEWGNMSPKAVHMYNFFGLIPLGDTVGHASPWWYLTDGDTQRKYMYDVKEWADVYRDHLNAKKEAIRQAAADQSSPGSKYIPAVKSTGHDHINIIDAIVNDNPGEFVVNIPNNGAIEGIPDDVVVEIPALVSGRGIQGLHIGRLPEPITLYLKSAVVKMEYLLSAYLSGSRNILTASYLNDPCYISIDSMLQDEPWLIRSLEDAQKRTDDLLASDEKLAAHFNNSQ